MIPELANLLLELMSMDYHRRSCKNAQQAVGRFETAGHNRLIDQGSCVELGGRAVPVRLDICTAASAGGAASSAKRRQQAQDASRD